MCGCNDIGAAPGNMGAHGHEGDGGCDCEGLTMRGSAFLVVDTLQNAHKTRRELIEVSNNRQHFDGSVKLRPQQGEDTLQCRIHRTESQQRAATPYRGT